MGPALHLSLSPQPCDNQKLFSLLPFVKFKEGGKKNFLVSFDLGIFKVSLKILPQALGTAAEVPYAGPGR